MVEKETKRRKMTPEIQKVDIPARFRTRAAELEGIARKKLPQECSEKAFWEVLSGNKEFLPICVVLQRKGSFDQIVLMPGS